MKFATREDIEAPIDAVFEQLSDFDGFERAALRRGADVVRTDGQGATGVGMVWKTGFDYRGRERHAEIELTGYDAPNGMTFQIQSAGFTVEAVVDLVAMSRARTRMNLAIEAKPKTIPARLMLQSLKLARGSVQTRFRRRVADFAGEIEERCKAG